MNLIDATSVTRDSVTSLPSIKSRSHWEEVRSWVSLEPTVPARQLS